MPDSTIISFGPNGSTTIVSTGQIGPRGLRGAPGLSEASADQVSYDNTDSDLFGEDVQSAIDQVAFMITAKENKGAGIVSALIFGD